MKTITVPKTSRAINAFLDQARDVDISVKTEDGTRFIVTAVDDFALEIEVQRNCKPLLDYLDECAKDESRIPLEEVKRRLGLIPDKPTKKRTPRTKAGQPKATRDGKTSRKESRR